MAQILNESERQSQKDAANDLALKMKLETSLATDMKRLFRRISQDVEDNYAVDGFLINANDYEDDIRAVLLNHYLKTSNKFKGRTLDKIKNKQLQEQLGVDFNIDDLTQQINVDLNKWIQKQAQIRSSEITKTNNKEINRSFQEVILGAAVSGAVLTQKQLAKEGAQKFRELGNSRAESAIAITETQNAAEGTKQHENEAVAGALGAVIATGGAAVAITKKRWVTMGDERVRPAHINADGQEQRLFNPFFVGGEQLMRPGDTSLGASVGNVIKCRCSSQVFINTEGEKS